MEAYFYHNEGQNRPAHRKTINSSAKYIKFNEIRSKIFLDALSKSDARWDEKQELFYMAQL